MSEVQPIIRQTEPHPVTRRVLVVDDEPTSVEEAVNQLQERNFEVLQEHTQSKAMERLAVVRFDAILLDLMLPKDQIAEPKLDPPLADNGLAILKRLREGGFEARGTPRNTPVFVISALGQEAIDLLEKVKRLGSQDIFGKPVRPVLVAETIRLFFDEPS